MPSKFEPEIVFPENPLQAAILFLAVMAYPERGAGQTGRAGSDFATALASYFFWSLSKSHGKKTLRQKRSDPDFEIPRKRDFEGKLTRGLKRLHLRYVAYGLFSTQLLQGFFGVRQLGAEAIARGSGDEVLSSLSRSGFLVNEPNLWRKALPAVGAVLAKSEKSWSERFAMNRTGPAADKRQKVKDIKRRAYLPSICVLHMAHGLNSVLDDVVPTITEFDKREPYMAMLMNSEKWIWNAIASAEKWRASARFTDVFEFDEGDMIKLALPNNVKR